MPRSWTEHKSLYEKLAYAFEPAARLVTKNSLFWRVLWYAAAVITLGAFALFMPKKQFLNEYATTLFPIQAYPETFDALSKRLLIHECRHTTHCVWLGYLVPVLGWLPGDKGRYVRAWCGAPFYTVLYLLFLLPAFFAIGRFVIELDCEKTAWAWQMDRHYKTREIPLRAVELGVKVCGPPYLFSIPRFIGVPIFKKVARTMRYG